jgi:hypothetical protein
LSGVAGLQQAMARQANGDGCAGPDEHAGRYRTEVHKI